MTTLDFQYADLVSGLRQLIADIEKGAVIVTAFSIKTEMDAERSGDLSEAWLDMEFTRLPAKNEGKGS